MTNFRTMLILLVIFVALALIVASQDEPVPSIQSSLQMNLPTVTPEQQLDGSLLRVFPDLAVLDMQAIRLEDVDSGARLTLVRDEDGNWTSPDYEGMIDVDTASAIARTLVLFPYARSINILNDTDFSDFGFNPNGQFLFQIIKTDGSHHIIAIGSLTESGFAYYTIVDERDEIFEVERGPVDFLKNYIYSPPINLTN